MTTKSYDILVFMNAPSPYWRDFAEYLSSYYSIRFVFYSTCSELGRPRFWDEELPKNCEIVRDGVLRVKAYFYDKNIITRIKKYRPKAVISQGVNLLAAVSASQYCSKHKIHFSLWNETWRDKNGKHRNLLAKIYAFLFRGADSNYSSSQEGVDFWNKFYAKPTKLYFVPASVDRYLAHDKVLDTPLTLLFGHRLITQFNPMGAYEIAKLVSEEMPVKLLMNGSGPLRTLIEEKVHAEGLEIVEFIDVKAFGELDEYYQRSTIAISPCQYSPGFIGNNEALASGCPIVISDKVGYHDLQIKEAFIGYILPLNYRQFADQIINIANDVELYQRLSRNAKTYIKKHLSNESVLALYDEIFASMGVQRLHSSACGL